MEAEQNRHHADGVRSLFKKVGLWVTYEEISSCQLVQGWLSRRAASAASRDDVVLHHGNRPRGRAPSRSRHSSPV